LALEGMSLAARARVACAVLAAMLSLAAAPPPAAPIAHERPSDMLGWTPEQQALGFRSIGRLFTTHTVRSGDHVRFLPKSRKSLDIRFAVGATSYSVASYMAAQRISGLLVIKDGRILLERYGLGRRPRDTWTGFSVTKSVTSILVGAALKDGAIKSLDDPVTRYLPEMKGSAYDDVTVRDLITMTSGVRWTEAYGDPNSDVVRIGSWKGEPGVDPIVSYMRTLPRVDPPGKVFHYKSGEADLVAVLVARATGKPLADYLSQKIWRPFGMERNGVWITDAAGVERGGCCLSMSLRDYARLGLFMLNADGPLERRVLPEGWIAQSTSPQVPTGRGDTSYGYMWWIRPGEFQAFGIFGQMIDVTPAQHLVTVINADWPSTGDRDLAATRQAFLDAVRAAFAKSH